MNGRTYATEAALVRGIVRHLEGLGCWVLKHHGDAFGSGGVPDLLVSRGGVLVGMEVKHLKPGESVAHALGRVSGPQRRRLEELRRVGTVADVVLSVGQAEALLDMATAGRFGPWLMPDRGRPAVSVGVVDGDGLSE